MPCLCYNLIVIKKIFNKDNVYAFLFATVAIFISAPAICQESEPAVADEPTVTEQTATTNIETVQDATESTQDTSNSSEVIKEKISEVAPAVKIYGSKKFSLLKTDAMSDNVDSLLGVTFSFGKKKAASKKKGKKSSNKTAAPSNEFSFNALLVMDASQICATVLDDFMMTVGSITFDGLNVSLDSVLLPKKMKAADVFASYVIADLQLIYYKTDLLNDALSAIGARLITHTIDSIDYRILMIKNKTIMQVTTSIVDGAKVISVENYIRKYRYTLEELSSEDEESAGAATNE